MSKTKTSETSLKPDKDRQVQIIRKEGTSHVPVEIRQESDHRLSSVFKNGVPHKGVSSELEKFLLPYIIDIPATSDEFRKAAREFWYTLSLKVPSEGAVLNISVDDDGMPVEPKDYILYKWALTHPFVALTKEAMLQSGKKRFYIHDPERETKAQNDKVKAKAKAMKEFVKVIDDETKTDRVLRVLGNANPAKMSQEVKENQLHSLMESNPKGFYEVATDESLPVKDFIAECISHEVLRKSGNSYFYMEDRIGENLDEAVAFFKDKKNSSTLNDVKAKLEEQQKLAGE